jgi:hypothetical protein
MTNDADDGLLAFSAHRKQTATNRHQSTQQKAGTSDPKAGLSPCALDYLDNVRHGLDLFTLHWRVSAPT